MVKKDFFKSMVIITSLLLPFNFGAQIPPITLHVETAGTLPSLISSDRMNQITDLTLTGNLNGTDIRFIREMAGRNVNGVASNGALENLNLAGINIVSGGNPYYSTYRTSNYIISTSMFRNCDKLKSITLPNNVISIGESVFYGCTRLIEIIISEQNQNYSSKDGVLFNKSGTTIIQFPIAKTGSSYVIPNSVTSIRDYAFSGCTGLISLIIGNSVKTIGIGAFSSCTGLASIIIPNNVTSVERDVFWGCTGLTSVTIGNGVTSIESAFRECTGLTSVTIEDGLTSIGYQAFSGCTKLTSINIPNSVKTIGNYAFSDCIGLTSIIIGNGVTSIVSYAFSGCRGLKSVIIGNSVKTIGSHAFYVCIGLTSIAIPNNVTSIGSYAFSDCSKLAEIHSKNPIPPSLGNSCFTGVDKKTCKIYVPIGSYSAYWLAWGFDNVIEENVSTINTVNKDNITFQSTPNGIVIETKEQTPISVYSLSGQIVYQSVIKGNMEIPLNKGIYILKLNNESEKVIVK